MNTREAEELACAALGLNYADVAEDTARLDELVEDRLGVTLEQLQRISELLMPLTIPGEAMITRQLFHGFIKDNVFIVKLPCELTDV